MHLIFKISLIKKKMTIHAILLALIQTRAPILQDLICLLSEHLQAFYCYFFWIRSSWYPNSIWLLLSALLLEHQNLGLQRGLFIFSLYMPADEYSSSYWFLIVSGDVHILMIFFHCSFLISLTSLNYWHAKFLAF